MAVVRQYIVICGNRLAFGKRDGLLFHSSLYTNCADGTNKKISQRNEKDVQRRARLMQIAEAHCCRLEKKKEKKSVLPP